MKFITCVTLRDYNLSKFEISRERLRQSEFRDVGSEKLLIAGLLKYKEILRKCSKEVKSEIFSSDRCKKIYEYVLDFYNKENLVFDSKAFEMYMQSKPTSERISYNKIWKSIIKLKKQVKIPTCITIIDKITKMYTARVLQYGILKTLDELKKADSGGYSIIEKAKEVYLSISPYLEERNIVSTITDPISLYEDFKRQHIRIQKDPSLLRSTPTGLEQLDNVMGGLRPSEFGLITAGTGVGKSIMMLDFGFHCYNTAGDVLYVTIEMPENQLRERFYCRMSGIEYTKYRKYSIDDSDWSRMDRKINKLKEHDNKFHILDIPRSGSVQHLRTEIEEFIRKNREPRLILIDYMNILQGGFDWSKQLEIAVDIKQQIARYFKIGTWSANQLMGSKHEKEVVKISDMAFAKNIVDNVDIGIGVSLLEEAEDEDDIEVFNVSFTKTRDFKGKSFQIQGDRSRMTFIGIKGKGKSESKNKKDLGGEVTV